MFGVCDGHGSNGEDISRIAVVALPYYVSLDPYYTTMPKKALRKACLKTDQTLTRKAVDHKKSGSTACVGLIIGSDLYVANVGDSRLVVVRRFKKNFQALQVTRDHAPDEP